MPKIMPRSSSSGSDDVAVTSTPTDKQSSVSLHYPMLTKMNYAVWAIKMRVYLQAQNIWDAIDPGTNVETRKDKMELAAIYEAIPEESLLLIAEKETAMKAWQTLETMYVGADRVKAAKLQTLRSEFEILRMKDAETIDDFAAKLTAIVSKIAGLGGSIDESTVVKKLLRAVPNELEYYEAMKKAGKNVEVVISEGVGHSFYLNKIAMDSDPVTARRSDELIDAIKDFVARH